MLRRRVLTRARNFADSVIDVLDYGSSATSATGGTGSFASIGGAGADLRYPRPIEIP